MFVPEFTGWPPIARLDRPIIVTEKLDGTNAAIGIHEEDGEVTVWAQSRSRIITPGKATDNYGFAGWVQEHKETLVTDLGPGLHFGEWWGSGVNRGYNVPYKVFSLFNTSRWDGVEFTTPKLDCVPVLAFSDRFNRGVIDVSMNALKLKGSVAAARLGFKFDNPEGVVVFHTAGNLMFKKTFEHDEKGKGNVT